MSVLVVRPLLGRDAALREAVVAESPCPPSAVDARPAEHFRRAHGQHLELRGRLIHLNAEGEQSIIDGAGNLGPDACGQKECCYLIHNKCTKLTENGKALYAGRKLYNTPASTLFCP